MRKIKFFFIIFSIPLLFFCRGKQEFINEYWDDGSFKVKVEEIISPLDGKITIVKYTERGNTNTYLLEKYYDNGQLAEKGNCINGEKEGVWISWYKDGTMSVKANYKKGKRSGTFKSWYPDGKELEEIEY